MEKRVVIFLVLSLAIILGYDLLLKQMGWLPEPPPVQEPPSRGSSSSAELEPVPALVTGKDIGSTESERPNPVRPKV